MDNCSIYVHIPFCKARCSYCAFSSSTDFSLVKRYFAKLFGEMEYFRNKDVPIYTVYIGGGTPSAVDKNLLNDLFDKLHAHYDLSQVKEISVECNPESVTEDLLRCLKANGVNRLSFGLQSVNDATLKRIGRLHNYKQFEQALRLAQQLGFTNINADLIVGLPESTQDFYHSVEVVASLPLQHVSVYALELHEGSELYKLCKARYPFSDDELADMYDKAVQLLQEHGYERYEISNFAKAGCECLHNLNYWQEGRYMAFGASASGFIGDVRYTNPYNMKDYLAANTLTLHSDCQHVSPNDQANEYVMLGLRLSNGLSLSQFAERYCKDFWDFFANARQLHEQGFLVVEDGCVRVPSDKLYVVNSILCELLNFDSDN
ncbi:MAG: radical SAM family heme chaperone HemW [Clostridiales bacterium]|nr:radical SAM family heme chaperone HemW [Clostridiales bacterium]